MTESVIALFTSRFEILKKIGNSTHNFYKKYDTNKEQKQQLVPDKDLGSVVLFGWKEIEFEQTKNAENPHKYWDFGTFLE